MRKDGTKYDLRTFDGPNCHVELRKDGPGPTKIVGLAAVFDSEAHNEVIRHGAFTKTLLESNDIRALWNHDSGRPLGRTKNDTLSLRETDKGLEVEIVPDPETTWGHDAMQAIKRGDVSGFSFGFEIVKEKLTERGDEKAPPLRELLEVKLFEVSPVTFPWYEEAHAQTRWKPTPASRGRGLSLWDWWRRRKKVSR